MGTKKNPSEEPRGFEDDPDWIKNQFLDGPVPQPDDPATALQTIGDWNETWISTVRTQGRKRIALSRELKEFIDETKYLARWCESVGLDSSPLIEYSHAAKDTYYGSRETLPPITDALWVLLERLEYRLHPFQLGSFAEHTSAPYEGDRKPLPADEAELAVRTFLKQHPGATIREVAKGVSIATGRVSSMNVWRVEQARRKAKKAPTPKREQRLTKLMVESIGRTDDPAQRIMALEAAWQMLVEKADLRERAALFAKSTEEKAVLSQLALDQYADDLVGSDDDDRS
jgi:hypothetical protein